MSDKAHVMIYQQWATRRLSHEIKKILFPKIKLHTLYPTIRKSSVKARDVGNDFKTGGWRNETLHGPIPTKPAIQFSHLVFQEGPSHTYYHLQLEAKRFEYRRQPIKRGRVAGIFSTS